MGRTGLILLQVLGGLSLLAYPFILIVNITAMPKVMSARSIPHLLVMLYPAVWIVLWIVSWMSMRRGSASLACWLSAIPVALSVIGAVVLILTWPKPHY